MLEHTPLFLSIAIGAAFLVGLSKGGLPSVGTLAVPLMALVISPVTAAALLLPIYVISDMFGLYLYRHHFSARNLAILIPAATVGVGVGWMFSSHLSSTFIGMLVGLVGIFFCVNAWIGARYRRQARKADIPGGVFWGILTGLTSFVSHSGAPPFQMYVLPQHLEKLVFAGTSTILFAVVNAVKLVPYWELQQFSHLDWSLGYWLIPAAVIGTLVGAKLTRIMPPGPFFLLVQLTLFGLSIKLIADWVLPFLG
ncbi:sulfite exporter TauE/SafE family protein [Falsochrobactrum sp. TDYN1]|uniref:Probable membrane transporter protein n=1 Tax=Falsochrobactrum tianjinense TaxID=2706015 RepID=A0A949PMM1_9HYPH|nr:sulfite exporter TauE/SafE family protein [Falsochrobactrum sp. TDYN1]MBV2143209.1 sulfite exporter TauE/SafE family protein [Falsochrobactrum sp. TDYN1]